VKIVTVFSNVIQRFLTMKFSKILVKIYLVISVQVGAWEKEMNTG